MFSYNQNKQYFLNLCEALIEQYETKGRGRSSKTILMIEINHEIECDPGRKSFFAKIDQKKYEEVANSFLCNISFDKLASGQFHLYYGILNPMSEANNLMAIYKGSMNWALTNGKITEEEKEEQFRYLNHLISQVG